MKHYHKILLALLIPLAIAMSTRAPRSTHRPPMMGPHMSARISNLINTQRNTSLPYGWRIKDFSFTDQQIDVAFTGPGQRAAAIRLAYPLSPRKGVTIGETRSFRVDLLPGSRAPEEPLRALTHSFFLRIKDNDKEFFFDSPEMKEREAEGEMLFKRYGFTPILCLALLAILPLALLNLRALRNYLLPNSSASWLCLIVIFAAALAARSLFSPGVPVHSNNHGIQTVRTLVYHESPEEKPSVYGEVYYGIMRWMLTIPGKSEQNVYKINILFGALSALAIFMLAKAFRYTDRASLLAALLQALTPSQVWLSGTESSLAMFPFFALSGLAFLLISVRTSNTFLLWQSAVLLAIASTLHLITVFFVPVIFIFYAYKRIEGKINEPPAFKKHLAACAIIFLAWLSFHILNISPERFKQGPEYFTPLAYPIMFFSKKNILFDISLTTFVVPLLIIPGFISAWRNRRNIALLAAAALPVIIIMGFSVAFCREDTIRYQAPTQWVYFLLASFSFNHFSPNSRTAAIIAVAALHTASAAYGLRFVKTGDEENNEYRFIRAHATRLPRGATIRLPVDKYAANGKLVREFPDYLNGYKLIRGSDPPRPGGDEIIYIGLDCYRFSSEARKKLFMVPGGLRRECSLVCGGLKPSPIFETTLDSTTNPHGFQKRFWLLGNPRPKIGFYKCPDAQP